MRKSLLLKQRFESSGSSRRNCRVGARSKHRLRAKKERNAGGFRGSQLGTILVPIDFTEASYKALDYALAMALGSSWSIALVHVVQKSYAEGFVDANQREKIRANAELEARKKLNTLASSKQIVGVPMKVILGNGVAEYEILRIAERLKVRMIILGRQDRNPLNDYALVQSKQKGGTMRIFFGTDFSSQAERAIKVAASLAAHTDSPLTLVHAVEPEPIEFMEKAHLDRLLSRLQKKLGAEAARIRRAGVEVVEKLILGSPHAELVAAAKTFNADLVIVASGRKSAPVQMLAGSVAERTAQNATVPTLVIREHESLLAWTRGERPLQISIGYDFSASADAALRFAATLRSIGPCLITVTYVSWPPNETLRFGIGGDTSKPGNTKDVDKLLERDLKEKCDAVFGSESVEIRVIPTWTREQAKLIEAAINNQADMIIVGTNQRTGLDRFWLGSVSRAILRQAPMNVICVPTVSIGDGVADCDKTVAGFQRVLVPIDFSEASAKSVHLAFKAVKQGGELCLLHNYQADRRPALWAQE